MIQNTKGLRFTAMLVAALALIGLNTWLIYRSYQALADHQQWVVHTIDVTNTLDKVHLAEFDKLIGVRTYLMTGREDFLETYDKGRTQLPEVLKDLQNLVVDNIEQTRNLDAFRGYNAEFNGYLERAITRKKSGTFQMTNIAAFLTESKQKIDFLRDRLTEMKSVEDRLMSTRTDQAARSKEVFIISIFAAAIINGIFIFLSFILFRRNHDQVSKEAVINANEAKIKDEINLLAKRVSGEVSANEVARNSLEFLASHFQFLASNFYLTERSEPELISSYGVEFDQVKKVGSTLVSEAAKRDSALMVTDVPANYWKIKSGLGEGSPKEIVFLPIKFQGRNFAVLELASFAHVSDAVLAKAERFTENIGIALNAAQSRDSLQALLEKTQLQSEELQVQQEELRSNNEELEQQARAMEEQQFNLSIKNADLEEVRKQLELKAIDLENSSKYKSEFLAKMSHELRTPLNSLLILSTLLIENKEKNLTDRQRDFATSIHNSGQDLLMLINDILDLSKIEAKKLRLKVDSFSAQSVLAAKSASFAVQAKSKGLSFETEAAKGLEDFVIHTDRQRLDQILRNFISNAIKFTESGKVVLSVEASPDRDKVIFNVTDTGVGIPNDKLDLIFEAFEQVDGTTSRKYGGTGLGLTISRELAHLLEGEIKVRSEPNKGSTFSLTLPAKLVLTGDQSEDKQGHSRSSVFDRPTKTLDDTKLAANQNKDDTKKKAESLLANIDRSKETILIIEDDDRFRKSVVESVISYGFQAIECASGYLAIEILGQITPSAILLDIKLPEVSGFVLLEMIKERPELRHVPVHIISGLEYQHNALRMGAIGYLTKPVTTQKISSALERIKSVIAGQRRRVLLIEDDDIQSNAISNIISGEDVDVVQAHSGKKALELLKSEVFDCIILDLKLADTSGFLLLEELNHLSTSIPPIVIYTGKDLTVEEEDYLRRYSESIIIKGARSPERLLDEVSLFLHRVDSLLPQDKRNILRSLRSNETSFEGKTVLIADDDLRNIFSLTAALESKGMTVRIAKDGVEALEVLEKFDDVDLVLMDIMMPRMNGYEAMQKIREHKNDRIRTLPMVALTAKAMKGDHEKCVAAGANDYLPKPINMDNFNTVLKVWLTRKGV